MNEEQIRAEFEAWEAWQAALSAKSVPEQMGSPIQKLMEYLTNILDEDEFNQCDSILAGQGIAAPQPTDNERVQELERTLELFRAATSQELHERIDEIMRENRDE